MSGHSKWATIKHKKAATDAKKGKEFTKAAAMIAIAAKQGGGDAKMNFSLRLAIDKARAVNMPAANIERAIKKGTGELGGTAPEELTYEGYASGGVAVLVEAMTDNRNRTAGEVRSIFAKHGGSMADAGSVAYLFEQKGQIYVNQNDQKMSEEETELAIIDSGADDFELNEGIFTVTTKSNQLQKVKEALESAGVKIDDAELAFIPKTEIKIADEATAGKILRLVDALEDIDDVTAVHANFDIPEEILEKIS
jgi:YebC/PmpR family DNA-binding regulatory protein